MAIQLLSNVKIITSGNAPTVANLLPGQAAFGKLTSDGKYHLFGNTGEGGGAGKVVDIVADTYAAFDAPTLESVLTTGNTTTLDILFKTTADGDTTFTVGPSGIIGEAFTVGGPNVAQGAFLDHNKPVLSAYADLTLTADDATAMRTKLDVFSKAEINAKLGGALHMKGSVEAFANLPTDAEVGDVYNVKTAGGTDIYGNAVKAGDNVVWVEAQGENPAGWDILSGVVDLTAYYTATQVDEIKAALDTDIAAAKKAGEDASTLANAAQTAADAAIDAADTAQTAADAAQAAATKNAGDIKTLQNAGYQTADDVQEALTSGHYVSDEAYVHTDNNFTDDDKAAVAKIVTTGDGSKVLTDNGTYESLELSVISI